MTPTTSKLAAQDLYIDLSNKKAMWHFMNNGVSLSLRIRTYISPYAASGDNEIQVEQLVLKVDLDMSKEAFVKYLEEHNLLSTEECSDEIMYALD